MLEAREHRCQIQQELINKYHAPLVCLTMNIAGPVKRTPLIRLLFDHGVTLFENAGYNILEKRVLDSSTGCEAFYSVGIEASVLKKSVLAIEDSFPAARLFDFDVIDTDGEKLSREYPRACIVCGGPVQTCSRSRAHGLERIEAATNDLLFQHAADFYADIATKALIREVHTTPKPGLVDENNCGAHRDMNLTLFESSAHTLLPYFRAAVLNGLSGGNMSELREAGKEAERVMLNVTNGVNTHKGAIFSFGLLLSAIGTSLLNGCDVFEQVRCLLSSESRPATPILSNGDKVRTQFGMMGAYEEAKAGFPSARYAAERLSSYRNEYAPNPEAFVLCDLMAQVEDTNIYHRGGPEGAAYVRREAVRISSLPFDARTGELEKMDYQMIRMNLSPGGCADLLALAFLIERWYDDSQKLFLI